MKKRFLFILILLLIPTAVLAEGLPTGDFQTNYNGMTYNYIQSAYRSLSMTSPFIESFNAPYNLRTGDGVYALYTLSKNDRVPSRNDTVNSTSHEIEDDGIEYILMNGYRMDNTPNIFDSEEYGAVDTRNIKEYITQIALWLYLYQNQSKFSNYCSNRACEFTNSSGEAISAEEIYDFIVEGAKISGYNYLNYIIKLVDNASIYRREPSQLSSISSDSLEYEIDKKNHILVTKEIHPTPTGNSTNFMGFVIEIDDPNQYGAYFSDNDGNKITDMEHYQGAFHLVVPLQEELDKMNLNSIQLHIKGYFSNHHVYDYTTVDSTGNDPFTHMVASGSQTEEIRNDYSLHNFVKISTLDPMNSLLAGATMVLTKKGDPSFNESWISGEDAHFIQLRNGEYTLCETKAPHGFEACTECVDFNVDGENVTVLDVKNDQKVEIPNTALFANKTIRNFGIVLLIIGSLIIGFNYLTSDNKNKA